MYKLMGPHKRPIGDHAAHGEAIHQSAIDRSKLRDCEYDPQNLRECLAAGNLLTTNTQRITRGTPCPPI